MEAVQLVGAAVVFVVMLGVGTAAHELAHAAVLRVFDVPFELEWFPSQDSQARLNGGLLRPWATVTPRSLDSEVPVWGLQLSAIAPLALTAPVILMLVGVLPDPLAGDNVISVTMVLAWLGCAIPSPQDFSLFWHADQLIENCDSPAQTMSSDA